MFKQITAKSIVNVFLVVLSLEMLANYERYIVLCGKGWLSINVIYPEVVFV